MNKRRRYKAKRKRAERRRWLLFRAGLRFAQTQLDVEQVR